MTKELKNLVDIWIDTIHYHGHNKQADAKRDVIAQVYEDADGVYEMRVKIFGIVEDYLKEEFSS